MSGQDYNIRQQLGRTIGQVEMNNAQQQRELKEILEAQIREKDYQLQKAYKVHDVGYRNVRLHRSKILGGPTQGQLGNYHDPNVMHMQNDGLINQE